MTGQFGIRLDDSQIAAPEAASVSRAWNVTLWILQAPMAAMFLLSGGAKLAGVPETVAMFDEIGAGQWFRYFTGGVEVISAALLLIPRLAAIGAGLLFITMAGAVATHLFLVGESPAVAAVLLLMAGVIAWKRYPALPQSLLEPFVETGNEE